MGALKAVRTLAWYLAIAGAAALITGCGPNDRLRDDYMGKPKVSRYQPIQRDENGNPILPEQEKNNLAE